MVPRTEHAAILKIHDNDGEDANYLLKCPLAPTIKKTKHNHAVGHCVQLGCRNPQRITQLGPVINAAVKQHDKPIGEDEWLMLKAVFWRESVQTEYKGCLLAN